MKIYWEILFPLLLFMIFIGWFAYDKISHFISVRRYKPENDRSRRPQEAIGGNSNGISNSPESRGTEERRDIPTDNSVPVEQNSNRIRNPFTRR